MVIAAIKKVGNTGKARTEELRKVIRKIEEGKRELEHGLVSLRWVRSYVGIRGNEGGDKQANMCANTEVLVIMEEDLKEV